MKPDEDITGELELNRAEVRAIKKLCEEHMRREDTYKYKLSSAKEVDVDNLRTRCKRWLVNNQR